MARRKLTGVLLVGGASRRFGSPKALVRYREETFAARAWRVLGEACDDRLAVGKASDGLPLPFELLEDAAEVRAPLAGVLAGLRAAKHDVCVILPVDCPFISPPTLRRLGEAVAIPQTGPLPGAYAKSMLPELERRLRMCDLSLRGVNANVVAVDDDELRDVDLPCDLDRFLLD
jgi:molybdopterin-guanine dinucleotide biosynthesis protein A